MFLDVYRNGPSGYGACLMHWSDKVLQVGIKSCKWFFLDKFVTGFECRRDNHEFDFIFIMVCGAIVFRSDDKIIKKVVKKIWKTQIFFKSGKYNKHFEPHCLSTITKQQQYILEIWRWFDVNVLLQSTLCGNAPTISWAFLITSFFVVIAKYIIKRQNYLFFFMCIRSIIKLIYLK
jgi:hypothetical protein